MARRQQNRFTEPDKSRARTLQKRIDELNREGIFVNDESQGREAYGEVIGNAMMLGTFRTLRDGVEIEDIDYHRKNDHPLIIGDVKRYFLVSNGELGNGALFSYFLQNQG